MRHTRDQIIERLHATLGDEEAILKERIAALKLLLRYDKENAVAKVESMYENSQGMAHVQMAELMLRLLNAQSEKEIEGEIDFGI